MWVCLFKDRNGRIYYAKKEDATVKLTLYDNLSQHFAFMEIKQTKKKIE